MDSHCLHYDYIEPRYSHVAWAADWDKSRVIFSPAKRYRGISLTSFEKNMKSLVDVLAVTAPSLAQLDIHECVTG